MIVVSLSSEVFYPILPGGLAQYYRYGPGLLERGIQLRMHTSLRPEHEGEVETLLNGVQVYRHSTTEGIGHIQEREELVALAYERTHEDPPDISHCLQPNVLSWKSYATLWRARRDGVSSLFYSMMFPGEPPTNPVRRLRHHLSWVVLRLTYDRMIVCSERMRMAYHDTCGFPLERMCVLPNGVDLERFSPSGDQTSARQKLGLPEDVPIVVTCASVVPRKGTDVLLDAWERVSSEVPGALLVICGSVGVRSTFQDLEMRRELADFTEKIERRVAGNPAVILAGEVDDVAEYHQAADLFVFASRREGLPNAVLEAMASGLPCVIAPFAGIPHDGEEFGSDGQHFVRSSHDPAVMADDLLDLLRQPDKGRQMGESARRLMEQTQSMEIALDSLAEIYRSALRKG